MDRVRKHIDEAEVALRAARRVLRDIEETPQREKAEATRAYRGELARIAYRLKVLGVSVEVIAQAFGVNHGGANRLTVRGEILNLNGDGRKERLSKVSAGADLWDSGLFSTRVSRIFRRVDIHSIDDLCERSSSELLALPGLGISSLREVECVLKEIGRNLKEQR